MITGFSVCCCPFCHTVQAYLHLKTREPCFVRCGKCGAHGPHAATPEKAVELWNGYAIEVVNCDNTGGGKNG